jgi:hypothetical protein
VSANATIGTPDVAAATSGSGGARPASRARRSLLKPNGRGGFDASELQKAELARAKRIMALAARPRPTTRPATQPATGPFR